MIVLQTSGACRNSLRALAILTISLSLLTFAQAEEPQEIGVPYLVESGTGKLIPLERQRVNSAMRAKALGFGGGSMVVKFNGRTSSVQVKGSGDLRLIIRFASMPPTPSSVINLDTLTATKTSRESVMAKAGAFGFGAKTTQGETEVQLKFLPGENSILSMQPVTPLPAGEYVVTLKDTSYGFLFSVIP